MTALPVRTMMALVQTVIQRAAGPADQRTRPDRNAGDESTGNGAARCTDPGTAQNMAGALGRCRCCNAERHD